MEQQVCRQDPDELGRRPQRERIGYALLWKAVLGIDMFRDETIRASLGQQLPWNVVLKFSAI